VETREVYHVTTKSIVGYVIFNNEAKYLKMKQLLQYYQVENPHARILLLFSLAKR